MKIKIISQGRAMGTKVVDVETGEELHNIRSIVWRTDVDDHQVATAEITIVDVPVEVQAETDPSAHGEPIATIYETTSLADDSRKFATVFPHKQAS